MADPGTVVESKTLAPAGLFSGRAILVAFSLTSAAGILTIVPSIATNKIIAVTAGHDGVALMGLFRSLGAMVTQALSLGFGLVILQKISVSRSKAEVDDCIGAASLLLALQSLLIAIAVGFGASFISRRLFSLDPPGSHLANIRIVLVMAFMNHLFQTALSILKGKTNLKPVAAVQILGSVSSLVLIYPLLSLGSRGLAVNVGSGSLVGAVAALALIWSLYRPSLPPSAFHRWKTVLKDSSRPSAMLMGHALVTTGSLLAVQALLNAYLGLQSLGNFNAAMLIADTMLMLIVASVRSYFLPSLGQLDDGPEKERLFSRMMTILLLVALAAGAAMIFAARPLMMVLFTRSFFPAAGFLSLISLSLIGQVYIWSYNTYLLHKGETFHFVAIDVAWAAAQVAAVGACLHMKLSLESVAWAQIACGAASAALYAATTRKSHGAGLLSRGNLVLTIAGVLWLLAAQHLSVAGAPAAIAAFLAASVATCASLLKYFPFSPMEEAR